MVNIHMWTFVFILFQLFVFLVIVMFEQRKGIVMCSLFLKFY